MTQQLNKKKGVKYHQNLTNWKLLKSQRFHFCQHPNRQQARISKDIHGHLHIKRHRIFSS